MELRAGWMLFLTPGKTHIILSETEDFVKFVWGFDFQDSLVEAVLCQEYGENALRLASEKINAALGQVMENAVCDAFGAYDMLKEGLYRIFIDLVRQGQGLPSGISHKEPSEELLLIRQYLLENPKTTADDVAELFYLSKSTLERLCKVEFRMSIHQLRRSLQAERSDRYSMGKFFKKWEGTPPGNYRKAISRY